MNNRGVFIFPILKIEGNRMAYVSKCYAEDHGIEIVYGISLKALYERIDEYDDVYFSNSMVEAIFGGYMPIQIYWYFKCIKKAIDLRKRMIYVCDYNHCQYRNTLSIRKSKIKADNGTEVYDADPMEFKADDMHIDIITHFDEEFVRKMHQGSHLTIDNVSYYNLTKCYANMRYDIPKTKHNFRLVYYGVYKPEKKAQLKDLFDNRHEDAIVIGAGVNKYNIEGTTNVIYKKMNFKMNDILKMIYGSKYQVALGGYDSSCIPNRFYETIGFGMVILAHKDMMATKDKPILPDKFLFEDRKDLDRIMDELDKEDYDKLLEEQRAYILSL